MTDTDKRAEAIEMLKSVAAITERNIAELESAIATDLNKGRYVILMDSSVIAACKKLAIGWNFSAMGVDAATFRLRDATVSAECFEYETGKRMAVVPVDSYYRQALESARTSLAFYREALSN